MMNSFLLYIRADNTGIWGGGREEEIAQWCKESERERARETEMDREREKSEQTNK